MYLFQIDNGKYISYLRPRQCSPCDAPILMEIQRMKWGGPNLMKIIESLEQAKIRWTRLYTHIKVCYSPNNYSTGGGGVMRQKCIQTVSYESTMCISQEPTRSWTVAYLTLFCHGCKEPMNVSRDMNTLLYHFFHCIQTHPREADHSSIQHVQRAKMIKK